MLRKYVSLDGEVLHESDYTDLTPIHRCFYCNQVLIMCQDKPCPVSQGNQHDLIELVTG